jgi:predicted acetyltransferase
MVFINEEARKGIWIFIRAHFSMVYSVKGTIFSNEPLSFLFAEGELEEKISPYIMARVVDVQNFMNQFPFAYVKPNEKKQGISFHISDSLIEWNCGVFSVILDENAHITIDDSVQNLEVNLDIQTFTTMMLSYKRPAFLKDIGRIEGSDEAIAYLEKIIPNNKTWFADYF